ncbi:MAG: hypothetical protein ABL970_05120 [Nitrospira sp.]
MKHEVGMRKDSVTGQGDVPVWTNQEQAIVDLLQRSGPQSLQQIADALSGVFGSAVLTVGRLQRSGVVSILNNGQVAIVAKRRG